MMEYYAIKNPIGSVLFFVKSYSYSDGNQRRESMMIWLHDQSPSWPQDKKEEIYNKFSSLFDLDINIVDSIFVALGWQTYIVKSLFLETTETLLKSGLILLDSLGKHILSPLGSHLFDTNQYDKYIKSISFKANFWKQNNVKITDNKAIGSGSFIKKNEIITCKHVVEDLDKSLYIEGENGRMYTIEKIIKHPKEEIDLAKITTREEFDFFPYEIEPEVSLLEKVLIFGYPPIPLTSKPFLLANLGEISSIVDNYLDSTEAIILSCITRPGNSGGPILNEYGKLIGIMAQNRHHQFSPSWEDMGNLDFNKGLGYASGLRAKYIFDF